MVVVGPTASGKSEYAVKLAQSIGGEIVSGDSMQIYRGMDIGTAKPTVGEMGGIPHHLIDIADITEPYSTARFLEQASSAIEDILSRGKMPIIAGGTGLYIDTLVSGITLTEAEDDPKKRAELFAYASEHGAEALHARLRAVDSESADSIHPNNIKRVVRAIEIYETTGITKSELDRRSRERGSVYDAHRVLLLPRDREILGARIERRVDRMFDTGLTDEVRSLCERGLRETPTASQAIGYKEFYPYLDGEITLDAVRDSIILNTKHYAKRQLTWFSRTKADETIEI